MESTTTNELLLNNLNNLISEYKDMSLDQKTRKLASVQQIEKIVPHLNADKLEIAQVLGWKIIVPANVYKPNDKIVYFEIDTKLPEADWSEFMRKEKFQVKTRKIRDRLTQGLIMPLNILGGEAAEKYQIGQDVTKELGVTKYDNDADLIEKSKPMHATETTTEKSKNLIINKEDAKQIMKEKKQAKLELLAKQKEELDARRESNEFPSHLGIPKTDEPRIQSFPEILAAFQGKPYYASLKYDGCSATYCFDTKNPIKREKKNALATQAEANKSKKKRKNRLENSNIAAAKETETDKAENLNTENEENLLDESLEETFDFIICSRNYISSESHYKKAEELYKIREKLEKAGYHIAIQCEVYGPKIGKNPQQMKATSIAVFNVFDINEKRFYDLDQMEKFCQEYDLPMVHVLEKGDKFNYTTIDELLEKVKGNYEGTEHPREGVVYRTQKDFHIVYDEEEVCDKLAGVSNEQKQLYLDNLRRMSFKVINNEFLLNKDKKK